MRLNSRELKKNFKPPLYFEWENFKIKCKVLEIKIKGWNLQGILFQCLQQHFEVVGKKRNSRSKRITLTSYRSKKKIIFIYYEIITFFFFFYRDQVQQEIELYGKLDSNFKYEEAPPRGSMEAIRDFSHKESYIKYYDDPNDPQHYAV